MRQWHQTNIPNPGYANTVYTNNEWNYVVVPKCASSIIIDSMNLQPGIDRSAKSFTFLRNPIERLKSYIFQTKCFDIDSTNKKIENVLHNYDNNDAHCYPYSKYIIKDDFDFIGILERFNDDFKNITNIIIQKMSDRDEATEINDMYDQCLNNYLVDLDNVYADDFKLFNEVQNDSANN